MICSMNKRVATVVALLGLAFAAGTRPAQAQDGNSWFDEPSTEPAVGPGAPPEGAPPEAAPRPLPARRRPRNRITCPKPIRAR